MSAYHRFLLRSSRKYLLAALMAIVILASAVICVHAEETSGSGVVAQHRLGEFIFAVGRPGSLNAQVGRALCNLYNSRRRPTEDARCRATYSMGGVNDVRQLSDGAVQMAILQADLAMASVEGRGPFSDMEPFERLRVIMPLHDEILIAAVKKDIRIPTVSDLAVLRTGANIPSSGDAYTVRRLLTAIGVKPRKVLGVQDQDPIAALCANDIDVALVMSGHPNGIIQQGIHGCGITLRSLASDEIRSTVKDLPYLRMSDVPSELYAGQSQDLKGAAISALLVTTTEFVGRAGHRVHEVLSGEQVIVRRLHPSLRRADLERVPKIFERLKVLSTLSR